MNPELFSGKAAVVRAAPKANTVNEAGGKAYEHEPEHAIAQLVLTGCFNSTFYVSAEDQLDKVKALAAQCDPLFLARLAVYAREQGFMKDAPAVLLGHLAARDVEAFKLAFPRVVDGCKMLRNVVQAIQKGGLGRKSLGTAPKRCVADWLNAQDPAKLFRQSVGTEPTLADVVKLGHPKPKNDQQRAFYGWLLGREHAADKLPAQVQAFEAFKKDPTTGEIPDVAWEMLTAFLLTEAQWKQVAKNASWTQTRMNLATFARHGVLKDDAIVAELAARLKDPEKIRWAKAFPYQLLAAYLNAGDIPQALRLALQDALEVATENVPAIPGKGIVALDVSGSMRSAPVTGARKGATSKVTCVQAASLIAACILRKNPEARVLPFDTAVYVPAPGKVGINPRDSVMTNAETLARFGGGGTQCELPLRLVNQELAKVDWVIFVSDNESWYGYTQYNSAATGVAQQWAVLKSRCPQARMACIDLTPHTNTQAPNSKDVMNIGGFSDAVFDVLAKFISGEADGVALTAAVKAVHLG